MSLNPQPRTQVSLRRALTEPFKGALIVLCVIALAGLLITAAVPAQAREVGGGIFARNVGGTGHDVFLGALEPPANAQKQYPSWCLHMWRQDPQPENFATLSTLTTSSQWGPDELDLTTPQLAWVLLEYQDDPEATNRAALAYLVHANLEAADLGHDTAQSVSQLVAAVRAQLPQVDALAQRYVTQARQSAAVGYSSGEVMGEGTRKGQIRSLGVLSSTGWVAGRAMTVTLSGPAVLTSTGSATWSGSSAEHPITLEWKSTGNGPVRASITYTDRTRSTLTRYVTSSNVQDTVSIGDRAAGDPVERRVATSQWNVVYDFQPAATSHVGSAKHVVDAPPSDVLTVRADPTYGSGEWMSIEGEPVPVVFEGTAYALGEELPEESSEVPEGARALGTATITARGPGEYAVSLDEVVEPGFMTWVWQVRRAAQTQVVSDRGEKLAVSELVHADWADSFGLEAETSSVKHSIDVDSALTLRTTKSGDYLVDDLFITGFPSNHPTFAGGMGFEADVQTITHELLFFPEGVEVADSNRESARVVASVEIPARNGFHASVGSPQFHVDGRAGTYVFVSSFAGDSRVKPFRSSVEDVTEQFRVEAGMATPTLRTHARDGADADKELAPAGIITIVDEVCYEGLDEGGEYRLDGTLMDRDSGEPVLGPGGNPVTSTLDFVAKEARGCVDVEFTLEGARVAGKSIVVFERLSKDGALIASHADIENEDQTVRASAPVTIDTHARSALTGEQSIAADRQSRVVDEVCYDGLTPGEKYTVEGVLMDRLLNAKLLADGKAVTGSTGFVPQASSGCVDVEFAFNSSKLSGRHIVVFQEIYAGKSLVAVHANIDNAAQTVEVTPPAPVGATASLANTGVSGVGALPIAVGILALGAAGVAWSRRGVL